MDQNEAVKKINFLCVRTVHLKGRRNKKKKKEVKAALNDFEDVMNDRRADWCVY